MTLATLFLALIVTPAAAGPGEPVLLDFQSERCGPCRQMRPAIEQLTKLGYPIKAIDVDRSRETAERYQVEQVPTFVVVDGDGKELGRTLGLQSPANLAAFYNTTVSRSAGETVAAADTVEVDAPAPEPEGTFDARTEADVDSPGDAPRPVNPAPWKTTVRIKMHVSPTALIFGSGTIIHSTPDESIILTCAHIFKLDGQRQLQPHEYNRKITVDLFDGQLHGPNGQTLHPTEMDIPAKAIDYNFNNDVGLIRIRPGRKLEASRVVPATWKPQPQMPMFTVGCSHGKDATAWSTRILQPRVNMSNVQTRQPFTTIKCAYQPYEGRSGGGLYTTDGYVAGVCDFADPNEHTGLYATPESIYALLDRNNLMALYQPVKPRDQPDRLLAANPATRRQPAASRGTVARGQSPGEVEPRSPGGITLPHPALAGVKMPQLDPGVAGSEPAPSTRVASNGRRPRPSPRLADADPGVPPAGTIAANAEVEASEDERFAAATAAPAPARPKTGKLEEVEDLRPAGSGSWKRSTRPFPAPSASLARP